ncbi:MAG: hypothetical protein IKM61_05370 [Eubacteriaceae bacterium]|nr:hypothetical protein [Eubacteriaceae bacterium]
MRRTNEEGSFISRLVKNLGLNMMWSVPGWLFLLMHFMGEWPLGLSITSFGLWILAVMVDMKGFSFEGFRIVRKDPEKENKNPYSKSGYEHEDNDLSGK